MPTRETSCGRCGAPALRAPRPTLALVGWSVVLLGALCMVSMLVLLRRGDTGWGGACGALAMLALGAGMWLQGRAAGRCPACGASAP